MSTNQLTRQNLLFALGGDGRGRRRGRRERLQPHPLPVPVLGQAQEQAAGREGWRWVVEPKEQKREWWDDRVTRRGVVGWHSRTAAPPSTSALALLSPLPAHCPASPPHRRLSSPLMLLPAPSSASERRSSNVFCAAAGLPSAATSRPASSSRLMRPVRRSPGGWVAGGAQ